MNYEEKYNEILEWARKNKARLNGVPIEEVLPELAESEDERIRKRLIEYFEGFRIGNAEVKWEGLNVQEVLAWLEKQKENPKSTDSISSDCVSDVKCEDRWHKVGDSLPDNGRLVLAKDCLGNVLLARYDGENWEVNVYDNEDHYCHNSISKWCEIPSEKQKDLTTENIYKHSRERMSFWNGQQKEQKPVVTHGETYHVDTLGTQQVIAGKMPQKPAEWSEEDERIRKAILGFVNPDKGGTKYSSYAELVKWSDWLKSLRPNQPKQEWSEEDEKTIDDAYCWLCEYAGSLLQKNYGKSSMLYGIANKLKSLRPSWKPSEEQMEALLNTLHPDDPYYPDLKSLYEQLKKL